MIACTLRIKLKQFSQADFAIAEKASQRQAPEMCARSGRSAVLFNHSLCLEPISP